MKRYITEYNCKSLMMVMDCMELAVIGDQDYQFPVDTCDIYAGER